MRIQLSPARLAGRVPAIPSKSYLHRAMICAALSDGRCRINGRVDSEDVAATMRALRALGCSVESEPGGYALTPGPAPASAEIFCGESGSTLRFLTPVAAALGVPALFTGAGRLPERPMEPILPLLGQNGVEVRRKGADSLPFSLNGRLKSGEYTLPGNISSQFITGLLLALPLCEGDSSVRVLPPFESRPYVELTVEVMNRFGVDVREKDGVFFVRGGRRYRACSIDAEGDWSSAAFWLCAGALGGDVTVTGLSMASKQADRAIVGLLRAMGADVLESGFGVGARASDLAGIDIDASQTPDLVPVLAVCGAFAHGVTRITGAARLRLKESDRLYAVARTLNALGANISQRDDGLVVTGGSRLDGGTAEGYNDHRIVMALAVAALGCRGSVTIDGAQCVKKSYPGFFDHYRALGGVAYELDMG